MAQFAVIHIQKGSSRTSGLGEHIDRKSYKTNESKFPPNADETKGKMNHHFISTGNTLGQDIANRIEKGYTGKRAIRKDAVRSLNIMLSGSHDRMKEIEKDPKEFKAWIMENFNFITTQYGKENLLRFTLHMDERTPHIHAVVVPIRDGRLTARDVMGNAEDLRKLQTEYGQAMERFGLERGLKGSKTKHEDVTAFYRRIENPLEASNLTYRPLSPNEAMKAHKNPDSVFKAKYEAVVTPLIQRIQAFEATATDRNHQLQIANNARIQAEEQLKKSNLIGISNELLNEREKRLKALINKEERERQLLELRTEKQGNSNLKRDHKL